MNFKINSRPLFTIIFKLKNDNFKTRDFSSHIERVLAGVGAILKLYVITVFSAVPSLLPHTHGGNSNAGESNL